MGEGTGKGKITLRYTWRKRHTERNRDIEKHRHTETDKKVRKGLAGKQGFNVRGRNMREDDGGENDQN